MSIETTGEQQADRALTAALKSKAVDLGADLVGVGPVERWEGAPAQMHPLGHWPQARNVVVVAIHHPDACVELGGIPDAHHMGPYGVQGKMNERLGYIQFHLARWLEGRGHGALPIPPTNIWRYRPFREIERPFGPDLSNIHAAACTGLGEIGYHGLLMTPEFGTWQRFCCMITDAPLVADPVYAGPSLCDRCDACVRMCEDQCGGALAHEVTGDVVLNIDGIQFRYAEKNLWRCAWSEHFGLDAFLDIPPHVTEEVILEKLREHGRRGGTQGPCLKYCRPPHLRGRYLHKEVPPQAPADRRLTERIRRMARDGHMSLVGIISADRWEEGEENDPREQLPDCRSAIVFAVDWPTDSDVSGCGPLREPCEAARWGASLLLDHLELDMTRELERWDYYSVCHTTFRPQEAAERLGLLESVDGQLFSPRFGNRLAWRAVLTQAPLAETATELVESRKRAAPTLEELRGMVAEDGADLVGVTSAKAVAEIAEELREQIDEDALKVNVLQKGPIHGQIEPEIASREGARVFAPEDWVAGARSVIVLGMGYPAQTLDRAGEEPAVAVGPYAFASYEVTRDIGIDALNIARELDRRGFRAAITYDVTGVGSKTQNPRFATPDIFSGRVEAAAAGLGVIGRGGFVITPEFGVRVRWAAVVTDAEIHPTEAVEGFDPCEGCEAPCIPACPVAALAEGEETCAGGRCFAARDLLRCDWAKRYALVADEGPGFMGSTTDVPPPAGEITAEDIAEAIRTRDPLQRHLDCILEPCLKACHEVLRARGIGAA
ncbi:MAG: hypothetical protein U9R79_19920 [Armatimonadota bacterium]|nr:hypothetical protein [Armatimonadota bacterium]